MLKQIFLLSFLLNHCILSSQSSRNMLTTNINTTHFESGLTTNGFGIGIGLSRLISQRLSISIEANMDYANANDYGFLKNKFGNEEIVFPYYYPGNSNSLIGNFDNSIYDRANHYSSKVNTGKEMCLFYGIFLNYDIIHGRKHQLSLGGGVGGVYDDQQFTVEDRIGYFYDVISKVNVPIKLISPLLITYNEFAYKIKLKYSYGLSEKTRLTINLASHAVPGVAHKIRNIGIGLDQAF